MKPLLFARSYQKCLMTNGWLLILGVAAQLIAFVPQLRAQNTEQSFTAGQGVNAPSERAQFNSLTKPPELTPSQKELRDRMLDRTHLPGPPVPEGDGRAIAPLTPDAPPESSSRSLLLPPADKEGKSPTDSDLPHNAISPQADGTFKVFHSTINSAGATSEVAEPQASASDNIVFMAANWFASYSTDGGQTFKYVDPYTQFSALDGGFCCDQTVIFDRARNQFIWQLQYIYSSTTQKGSWRTAFASASTVASGGWCAYTWSPANFGLGAGLWLDYPNVALSNNYVWYSVNIFNAADQFQRSVVWRIPLSSASTCSNVSYSYFTTTDRGSLAFVQGATSSMYFAAHNTTSSIRIYNWAESSSTIFLNDVGHSPYTNMSRGTGLCPGPDGRNTCGRSDSRILTGWVANGVIGFMWNASQGGSFPYPYTYVARFNESTKALIDQPVIWNSTYAFIYPAMGINDRGHLAGTVHSAGGSRYPQMDALILDDFSSAPAPWELYGIAASSQGTVDRFGDYYSSRPHGSFDSTWVVTGETIAAGGQVQPRYVWFGRERDTPSLPTLSLTPSSNFASSGNVGGPFSPSSQAYTVQNTGTGTLNWTATSSNTMVATVSPPSGALSAGGSSIIAVSIAPGATSLSPGNYSSTLSFTNTNNGSGNTTRTADLKINMTGGGPANDNFASATTTSGNSGTTNGTNVGATGESGEPNHAGVSSPLNSVWYKWTAPSSGIITVDTFGSSFDTTLAVYTGAAVNALIEKGSNDDSISCLPVPCRQSQVTGPVIGGVTYFIAVDGFSSATGTIVLNWSFTPDGVVTQLFSAVLPYARSVLIGQPATAFGSLINAGAAAGTSCSPALPSGVAGTFAYQTTDAGNNLSGTPNTPVNIAAGATQNFVFGITPTSAINSQEVGVIFDCTNTSPAPSVSGVNTLILSASASATPDLIAVGATTTNDGIVHIPGNTGTHFFAAAAVNIGAASGAITAIADDGGRGLNVALTICQTNPSTGACINPVTPGPSATFAVANSQTVTLTIFVKGTGLVPFDPAGNRLFLRLKDGSGVTRGATNVAACTSTSCPGGASYAPAGNGAVPSN